jgi:cellulose synthase/poly-beta-1,6-N-acetylglucosamine synthase-like glycosyltransferase
MSAVPDKPTRTMSVDLPSSDKTAVAVSIVVPVRNEADNVAPLIAEITGALDGRWAYEVIYVNDGSTDATAERLAGLMKQHTNLRQLRHEKSSGQSAAVRSGVRAARGRWRTRRPGCRPTGRTQGHRFQENAVANRQRRAQRDFT